MDLGVKDEREKAFKISQKDSAERKLPLPTCGGQRGGVINLAVTSPDLQFVSDLCALLIEIFNLGTL